MKNKLKEGWVPKWKKTLAKLPPHKHRYPEYKNPKESNHQRLLRKRVAK